jgi:hypothetical protein
LLWTGDQLLVVGFPEGADAVITLQAYDPDSDTWDVLDATDVLSQNATREAFWTGSGVVLVTENTTARLVGSTEPGGQYVALSDRGIRRWTTIPAQAYVNPSAIVWSGSALSFPVAGVALLTDENAWVSLPPNPSVIGQPQSIAAGRGFFLWPDDSLGADSPAWRFVPEVP